MRCPCMAGWFKWARAFPFVQHIVCLFHIMFFSYYSNKRAWVVQWLATCLVFVGTWVRSPGPPNALYYFSSHTCMQRSKDGTPYTLTDQHAKCPKRPSKGQEVRSTMLSVNKHSWQSRKSTSFVQMGLTIPLTPPIWPKNPLGFAFLFLLFCHLLYFFLILFFIDH